MQHLTFLKLLSVETMKQCYQQKKCHSSRKKHEFAQFDPKYTYKFSLFIVKADIEL